VERKKSSKFFPFFLLFSGDASFLKTRGWAKNKKMEGKREEVKKGKER